MIKGKIGITDSDADVLEGAPGQTKDWIFLMYCIFEMELNTACTLCWACLNNIKVVHYVNIGMNLLNFNF